MIAINIVGTGNVAWHLAKVFHTQKEVIINQVAGRSKDKLTSFKGIANKLVSIDHLKPADITIVAVSDDHIEEVCASLPFENELVVHTSGFTHMLLQNRINNKVGVFYPLQSFSKEDKNIDFKEIPLFIEAGNKEDEKLLISLGKTISENVQVINSAQRRQLHLAAVFANNFTNYCYSVAQDICVKHNVSFETLHPLLLKTAQKAIENGPLHSQTGPAKRNDKNVISIQEELLEKDTYKKVYQTITEALQKTYGKKL